MTKTNTTALRQSGFTIIELMVIVLVIIILTVLVFTSLTSYRQKNRNSEREADIKLLHTQVEAYFAQNAKYPTRINMNTESWLSANMKSLDTEALRDPSSKVKTLAETPAATVYSYEVRANDDTACDNEVKDCVKYILTATYEGTVGSFSRSNLN